MWDLDKRTWNFYVELILGDQLYLKVYDTVAASSWVTVNFPPVRAKGIRIFNRKGNTVNDDLAFIKVFAKEGNHSYEGFVQRLVRIHICLLPSWRCDRGDS